MKKEIPNKKTIKAMKEKGTITSLEELKNIVKPKKSKKKKFKEVLQATEKNDEYINSLPKIYGVHYWYHYGVREYPLAFWKEDEYGDMIPYVYYYDDHNGTTSQYELQPLFDTTTGGTVFWTMNQLLAEKVSYALEMLPGPNDIYTQNDKFKKALDILLQIFDESYILDMAHSRTDKSNIKILKEVFNIIKPKAKKKGK